MNTTRRVVGGILLVSGTTIGAAMLALPVVTGLAGFFPALTLFFIYWSILTYSAFLMLEVTLWNHEETNLTSMARMTLGRVGEVVSWTLYLFLLYALTTAYLAGSSHIVLNFFEYYFGVALPVWLGPFPLLVIFCFFVYKGTHFVDYANRLLMCCLAIAYFFLIGLLVPEVEWQKVSYVNWKYLFISNSIIATSFGFHIIIPTLATYLKRNVIQLKTVIMVGSIIPLIIYIIWEVCSLGVIPLEGSNGIIQSYFNDENGAHLLAEVTHNPTIDFIAPLFAFFAIVTSFLGVSLSLCDFLADGLKINKKGAGRLILYVLTFLPTLTVLYINPYLFLAALEFAGAFGVMILLCIFPALMVWRGRYVLNLPSSYTAPGGKKTLLFVILFSGCMVLLEMANKLGMMDQLLWALHTTNQ